MDCPHGHLVLVLLVCPRALTHALSEIQPRRQDNAIAKDLDANEAQAYLGDALSNAISHSTGAICSRFVPGTSGGSYVGYHKGRNLNPKP